MKNSKNGKNGVLRNANLWNEKVWNSVVVNVRVPVTMLALSMSNTPRTVPLSRSTTRVNGSSPTWEAGSCGADATETSVTRIVAVPLSATAS